MDLNLKAFMKPELKDRGTMEFPGIDLFKDEQGNNVPFIIKRLSMNEIREIRKLYRTKKVYKERGRAVIGANGQVAMIEEYDSERAGAHIMVEAFVQPKLDAPELMEYYGVLDRMDMPALIFSDMNDFRYADRCVMEACGMSEGKDEEEVVEEVKN